MRFLFFISLISELLEGEIQMTLLSLPYIPLVNMIRLLTYLCLAVASLPLFADNSYVFSNISTKDGLSQNDVNCILQDRLGFMWFGTYDGVCRYNGYDFEYFRFNAENDNSLNSNLIHTISEDAHHNIWVGTDDKGLCVIRHSDQKIINIVINENGRNLLAQEVICGIHFFKDIAVITAKDAVFFIRFTADHFTPLSLQGKAKHKLRTLSASMSIIHNDSTLAIGTVNGIHYIELQNTDSLAIKYYTKFWKTRAYDIKKFRDGLLISDAISLYFINKYNKEFPFLKKEYRSIWVEDDQTIWAGNSQGLHKIRLESASSLTIKSIETFNNTNTKNQIQSNAIKAISEDNLGNLWIGTEGGGVTQLSKRGNKFSHFGENTLSKNLHKAQISALYEDSQQQLWIGTTQYGVSRFPKNIYDYNTQCTDYNINDIQQHNILGFQEIVSNGERFIIAASHYPIEIQVFDINGHRVKNTPLVKSLEALRHPVFSMAADQHYLWLGTYAAGLYRLNLNNFKKSWLTPQNTQRISSKIIRNLYNDSQDRLWIGTDKGLNLMPSQEKRKHHPKVSVFKNNPEENKSISYDYILPITETRDGEIWIGTLGGGLNRFNEKDTSFTHITSQDGLSNNSIKGIVEDQDGHLWISSNKGISRLNRSTKEIVNYSITDGLQDYEFREMAFCSRANGEILFGGNNGFNSFHPKTIKTDSSEAKIWITALDIVGPSIKSNYSYQLAALNQKIDSEEAIILKHKENSFTAYFTALHYIAPEKINYKYRLIGFDRDWNNMGAQSRFAKYTNLNPGHYTLEILASNSDGVWEKSPKTLHISIKKPWYNTWFAILCYASLAMATFLFFRRYSFIRNKIKNELMMEHFEKEKVEELTQIKLRFFTNISHELRTPLTIIKSYFDGISRQWESLPNEKINNDFGVINRNIDALMRLINQILDFRKMEQNKMELKLESENIILFTQNILSAFEQIAKDKNILLNFHHKEEKVMLAFDKEKMEKIINNLLSNAFKYTPNNGQVDVSIIEEEQQIALLVKDNGIGIKAENQIHIFERFYQTKKVKAQNSTGIGLSLTKGLVDLHQGSIEVQSEANQGSTFTVCIPKKIDQSLAYTTPDTKHHNNDIPEIDNAIDNKQLANISKFKEKTILVVEDNHDLRRYLVQSLAEHFTVLEAENGQIGLELSIEQQPDMLISDVMMPIMDGYELCHSIKNNEHISHIPVLLLTAKNTDEAQLQGFKLGADAYISKPFNLEVLIARILNVFISREKIIERISKNPFFTNEEVAFTVRDEEFLNKISAIIKHQMAEPNFSVEQLSEEIDISKLNLNKKIKALTGKTTVQYIRHVRLCRAAELLKQQHNRISEVTYEVGYGDLQHFREHFKKEFGMAPSAYQKAQQGK